jgi:Holliday junction resolvasome RuvABC DNA-binding subunit
LIALGYKQVDAAKSVRAVALKHEEAGTEELVRLALKGLV